MGSGAGEREVEIFDKIYSNMLLQDKDEHIQRSDVGEGKGKKGLSLTVWEISPNGVSNYVYYDTPAVNHGPCVKSGGLP